MTISELQPKTGGANLVLEIVDKSEPREFEKFGKTGKVANATGKDETGSIKITLWNEQIDQINVGDKVKVDNGYVNEWQGDLQLSAGKFGTFEVIGKSEGASPSGESAPAVDAGVQEEIIE